MVHFLFDASAAVTTSHRAACATIRRNAGVHGANKQVTANPALVTCARCRKSKSLARMVSTPGKPRRDKVQFIAYLRDQLIPDLRASGREFTADDFETAIKFMEE